MWGRARGEEVTDRRREIGAARKKADITTEMGVRMKTEGQRKTTPRKLLQLLAPPLARSSAEKCVLKVAPPPVLAAWLPERTR